MDLKYTIWGMAGVTGLIALFVVGVAMHAALGNEAPAAPGVAGGAPGTSAPANAAQERVLSGYDVAFWGEGRPFVRVKERFFGEVNTVNLVTHLAFELHYAESGPADEGGYTYQQADPAAVESAYRLGLIHEFGLFGMPSNTREALYCYRIAAQAGHAEAKLAAQRATNAE